MRRHAKRSTKATICALAALCVAMLALSATASAARPVFKGTFSCAAEFPSGGQNCGGDTSFNPERLAVDESSGDVYVIDQANDAIQVFDEDGTWKDQLVVPVDKGGTFGFSGFDDIAVDNSGVPATQGNVYVGAGTKHFGFDSAGDLGDLKWEASTSGGSACGIAVDTSGAVFGAEYGGNIQQLDAANGTPVGSPIVTSTDSSDTCSIAFDSQDNLYLQHFNDLTIIKLLSSASYGFPPTVTLSDSNHTDVEVNRTLDRVYTVSSGVALRWYDNDVQPIISPFDSGALGRNYIGVTVNSETNRIYVTDAGNGRVEVWELPQVKLEVFPNGAGTGTVQCDSGLGPQPAPPNTTKAPS